VCLIKIELDGVDSGSVYTWGSGEYGQLGHGDVADIHTPQKIHPMRFFEAKSATVTKAGSKKFHVGSPLSALVPQPSFSEFSEPELQIALRALSGRYRPVAVLRVARQLGDLTSLGTLLELQGDWPSAVAARLKSFALLAPDSKKKSEMVFEYLDGLLREPLVNPEVRDKESALYSILSFWAANQLPPSTLETFLRERFDAAAPILGSLLERNPSEQPFVVAFSEDFYLDVTERCIKDIRQSYLKGTP